MDDFEDIFGTNCNDQGEYGTFIQDANKSSPPVEEGEVSQLNPIASSRPASTESLQKNNNKTKV